MHRYIDLSGKKFGDWTVSNYSHTGSDRSAFWICECICGEKRPVRAISLRRGASTGCGCSADKRFSTKLTVHGLAKDPIYTVWQSMRDRCNNPNNRAYKNYGGRGIIVCPAWDDFEQFHADMHPRPSLNHSIDRKDNNGPYSKANCRWATRSEQNRNHRRNRKLTYNGETLHVIDWAKKLGLTQQALQYRLNNWPLEKALGEPFMRRGKKQ